MRLVGCPSFTLTEWTGLAVSLNAQVCPLANRSSSGVYSRVCHVPVLGHPASSTRCVRSGSAGLTTYRYTSVLAVWSTRQSTRAPLGSLGSSSANAAITAAWVTWGDDRTFRAPARAVLNRNLVRYIRPPRL